MSPASPSSASPCPAPTPASSSAVTSPARSKAAISRQALFDQLRPGLRPTQTITATTPGRSDFGYTTRLNFAGDVVSNTAAGPLAAHLEMQSENGNGFDNTGADTYINKAYVTWAGITAGKAAVLLLVHRRRRGLGELLLARPEGLQPA